MPDGSVMQRWHRGILTKAVTSLVSLAMLALFAPTAGAESWRLARGPSLVEFTIDHLIFSEVSGRFGRFEGTVNSPGDDFASAKVEVAIDVASIYTGHADRDRHLLAGDFFDVERFPEMRFESRSVEPVGPGTYHVVGDLTIRGITHDVELEALYSGERETTAGKRRDYRARGSINRSDYGLRWNDLWAGRALIGEEVEITLVIALVEAPS